MKKEWVLTLLSVAVTLVLALGAIRWLAPGLLGYAVDQQLVQVDRAVPPFFSNIFREEDYASQEFIINDPVLVARAKPLYPDILGMGPNDILGFRNRDVPVSASIVTIGDSQTYGNNAALEQNWPSWMERALYSESYGRVYNMSVGAWGGINYLAILESALKLRPRIVVVAFYTGNDPYSDARNAYSIDEWKRFRTDPAVTADDVPPVGNTQEVVFPVTFADGVTTAFTPDYRYISNNRQLPAIRAGYEVMWLTAQEMHKRLIAEGVHPVFTIIPTKELVYSAKVKAEQLQISTVYDQLVEDETQNIKELATRLVGLQDAQYIDVITPLSEAALTNAELYPPDSNGHPYSEGYRVIGEAVAEQLGTARTALPMGLVGVVSNKQLFRLMLLTPQGKWEALTAEILQQNGWTLTDLPGVLLEDVSALPYLGVLDEVDPARFGPEAFR
jgi:lysophospholipase L1-like esterase